MLPIDPYIVYNNCTTYYILTITSRSDVKGMLRENFRGEGDFYYKEMISERFNT